MTTNRKTTLALILTIGLASKALAVTSIILPAYPLWTDTGITLSLGQQVTVTASGTWDFGVGSFGPAGSGSDPAPWDRFSSVANHGAVIGFIGSDPFQGHYGDGTFFPRASGYLTIGSSSVFTSSSNGHFWLGINDDAVSENTGDNSGAMNAQVTVVVPEPAGFQLALTGLALSIGVVIRSKKQMQLKHSQASSQITKALR